MLQKNKISHKPRTISIHGSDIHFVRDSHGTITLEAPDEAAFQKAQGYLHAHERYLQMELLRLLGQGRLCECLKDTSEHLEIDIFMRHYQFAKSARAEMADLDAQTRDHLTDYAKGVNHYLETSGAPWSFWALGHRPEPWKIEDTLLTTKLISFLGLAQTQQDAEKWIATALKEGLSPEAVSSLFAPHCSLEEAQAMAPWLSKVDIPNEWRLIPSSLQNFAAKAGLKASNNWAVAGNRSSSDYPLMACDPHLEVNRLPTVWCEIIAHTPKNYFCGISMPGIPGIVMGRTRELSFSFTYGFMDMVDYFIEDVQDQTYLREEGQRPLELVTEVIKRKKHQDYQLTLFKTDQGVIEAPLEKSEGPDPDLGDGLYLARAMAGDRRGAAKTMQAVYKLYQQKNAQDAANVLSEVELSANWIVADKLGNISSQQSGLFPKRAGCGLIPLNGWESANLWQGFHAPDKLISTHNPQKGYLLSANQENNPQGGPKSVNLPMASYRYQRIQSLLENLKKPHLDDFKRMQKDLYSLQAKAYLDKIRPLIQNSGTVEILNKWDLRYDKNSRGAVFFEDFYHTLIRQVFGAKLGQQQIDELISQTSLVADYYGQFDRILLDQNLTEEERNLWFPDGVTQAYRRALNTTIEKYRHQKPKKWGEINHLKFKHILWGETWLGRKKFNRGPFSIEGSRATISQGNLFHAHGRPSSFAPSWRFLTNMASSNSLSSLPGSSQDQDSKYLDEALDRWLHYKYKDLTPPYN